MWLTPVILSSKEVEAGEDLELKVILRYYEVSLRPVQAIGEKTNQLNAASRATPGTNQ